MIRGRLPRQVLRALAFWPALFFVSGCCCFVPSEAETVVVVVPSRHDGHVGAVVVSRGERQQLLNTAYATARATPKGEIRHTALKPRQLEELQQTFAAASAALPPKAQTYTLYFDLASENLTPESSATLDEILTEVAKRSAAEILVVGHSDSLGTPEANLALSQRRAERLRELVIERGAAPDIVTATGVGERDLMVATGDEVDEVRNRRVEVTIR
jgi:outer membrane protein OmpA-like peptidoglycan-associated protein